MRCVSRPDLLHIEVPNQIQPLDGLSILPLIQGHMQQRARPLGFMHYGGDTLADGAMAWVDNRYKLFKQMPDQLALFDMLADPWEKNDIAAEHPDIVKRMDGELEAWRKSVEHSGSGADYPGGLPKPEQP